MKSAREVAIRRLVRAGQRMATECALLSHPHSALPYSGQIAMVAALRDWDEALSCLPTPKRRKKAKK